MIGLTQQRHDCLAFLEIYMVRNCGTSPSFREIMRGMNLKSTNGVTRLMAGLENKRRIRRRLGKYRSIEILCPVIGPRKNGEPLRFIPIEALNYHDANYHSKPLAAPSMGQNREMSRDHGEAAI